MAELDPQQIPPVEVPEIVAGVVVIEEVPAAIPPDRPRKVYAGMWGPLEIVAVSLGAMAIVVALWAYFFFVIPSNNELARNRSEADRLEADLISARSKYGQITSTETQVARLVASVDDFETRFLPLPANGQTALYQRLNGLILAYGLVNTSGPEYAPLETADIKAGQQTDEEKGRAKYRSLYPGVYVSTTVEGTYQNLRRFIREIETGREFIVVSAVELAPSETQKQKDLTKPPTNLVRVNPTLGAANPRGITAGLNPVVQDPAQFRARQQGKMHGEIVSLHIEMAAYFRRPNFVPMGVQP